MYELFLIQHTATLLPPPPPPCYHHHHHLATVHSKILILCHCINLNDDYGSHIVIIARYQAVRRLQYHNRTVFLLNNHALPSWPRGFHGRSQMRQLPLHAVELRLHSIARNDHRARRFQLHSCQLLAMVSGGTASQATRSRQPRQPRRPRATGFTIVHRVSSILCRARLIFQHHYQTQDRGVDEQQVVVCVHRCALHLSLLPPDRPQTCVSPGR
jgi:hypothetical protein